MSTPALAAPPPSIAGARGTTAPGPARFGVALAVGVVAVLLGATIAVLFYYARASAGATFGLALPAHATPTAAAGVRQAGLLDGLEHARPSRPRRHLAFGSENGQTARRPRVRREA